MASILSPPPGHPGAVAVGRRGGRVGLEAELRGSLRDAVDEEVLVLVVAVLAHDGTGTRTGRKLRTHKNADFTSTKAPYSHRCMRHVGMTITRFQAWHVVSTRQWAARPTAP